MVDIDDPAAGDGESIGDIEYEDFIASGDPEFAWKPPEDEWDAIALNYTSGTTGNPKGRRLPPPRRLPERDRQPDGAGDPAASGLSLDPADVPL